MKRWLALGLLVPLASIEACGSGPDLTATAADVAIVQVAPSNNCGGSCSDFVSGFALGAALAFPMLQNSQGGPALSSVDFGNRSAQVSLWAPTTTTSGGQITGDYDIASSGDGQLVWAGNPVLYNPGTTTEDQVTIYSAAESAVQTPSAVQSIVATLPILANTNCNDGGVNDGGSGGGGSGNCGNQNNSALLTGLAADPDAIYVEYAQDTSNPNGGNQNTTPDSPFFPGTGSPSDTHDPAAIARIDRSTGATSATSSGFFVTPFVATHTLAENTNELYFPDEGQQNNPTNQIRVLALTKKPFGTTPTVIGALTPAQSAAAIVVGIAANDAYVAWSVSHPTEATTGCQIFASAHDGAMQTLYDGFATGGAKPLTGGCSGMAVDDTYAYVAMTSFATPQSNSGGASVATIGSGIARVPLAGGAVQIAPLQSQRWYGPRRVFVDATYVYAIDPGFIARFSKSDFR